MEAWYGDEPSYGGYDDDSSTYRPGKLQAKPCRYADTKIAEPAPNPAQASPTTTATSTGLPTFSAACIIVSLPILLTLLGTLVGGTIGALLGATIGLGTVRVLPMIAEIYPTAQPSAKAWDVLLKIDSVRMSEAKRRCDAFLALTKEAPATPESASTAASVQTQLPELVECYLKAKPHAAPAEAARLAIDLVATVEKIGIYADQQRETLLRPLITSFDTQRTFLNDKTSLPVLRSL